MKQFQKVAAPKQKRSAFDLSHEKKLSANMGDLVPVLLQEVIPGDRFKVNTEHLMRFQPMLAPIMHRINVFTHYFFVPNRLIWNEWESFITAGKDGFSNPNFPKIISYNEEAFHLMGVGSLADYLGAPSHMYNKTSTNAIAPLSQLPFRAYQLIYNEYYRDQNLHEKISIPLGSVDAHPDEEDICSIRKRSWEKDYFTSALPWPQRGPDVNLPISGNVNVDGTPLLSKNTGGLLNIGGLSTASGWMFQGTDIVRMEIKGDIEGINAKITDVRRMFSIQRWFEKNARFGSRYIENILAHFGVKSSDSRLQRPEYLGGGRVPVQISEVLQQSETGTTPQGTMSGHGITAGMTGFNRSFEEHGIIIGIMSIVPRTTYYQGLPKFLQKFDRFEFFWPDFAHIGEQPVKSSELYHDVDSRKHNETFGFQERYAEYRSQLDSVHGDFRTNLDFWHMGRKFISRPTLNGTFIESNPAHRIFAVQSDLYKKVLIQVYHNVTAIRPIPKFGTPM